MRPPTRRLRSARPLVLALLLAASGAGCAGSEGLETGDPVALAAVSDAHAALEAGDRGRALVVLESALERRPRSLEVRREFARLAASSNRLDEALASYETVLGADPSDAETARGLMQVALFVGRPDLVLLARRTLEESREACAETAALLAREALERGAVQTALGHARRAVELAPTDAEAHFRLGQAQLELDQPADARSAFESAVSSDPGHAGAQQALGTLLLQEAALFGGHEAAGRGREALARADAIRSLETQAFGHADANERRARALAASREHPHWSGAWFELGRAELELGDAEAAARALDRALESRPRRPGAARLRGRAALALGDEQDADRFERLAADWVAAGEGR